MAGQGATLKKSHMSERVSLMDAAIEAARLRFRPIIMTSMGFILGVVPLVTAAGAASRHSIGIGVFGGMLAATFLAIFFVPLFFVLIGKLSRRKEPVRVRGTESKEHDTGSVGRM